MRSVCWKIPGVCRWLMAMSVHIPAAIACTAPSANNPRSGAQKLSSQKQRTHPRCPCQIPVKIVTADRGELDGVAVNIGLGGMYVECSPQPAFNSAVQVRFRLPTLTDDSVIDATVRWAKPDGSGLQFGSLRARDVWAINQLLRTVA